MKRKFIIRIGIVLAIAIAANGILQHFLYRYEQFRLIDNQIETTASLLISSKLSRSDLLEFENADAVIRDIIGGDRFNHFFIILDEKGREVYRSNNAKGFPFEIPKGQKWNTLETEKHIFRILTLPLSLDEKTKSLKRDTRILQTGLILDANLLRWKRISIQMIAFSIFILFLIIYATYWLSKSSLKPLVELANYLNYLGHNIEQPVIQSDSEEENINNIDSTDKDEFSKLVHEVDLLRKKFSSSLKKTQVWTAQMAHEMKTPLTIMQNSLERLRATQDSAERQIITNEISNEIFHLNSLITSFLEWSTMTHTSQIVDEVHAINLESDVKSLVDKFNHNFPNRFKLIGHSQLRVFANKSFFQQAVSNLLTNSLKYSPRNSIIKVIIDNNGFTIEDKGPGIPQIIINKLGEPFNYIKSENHGFGLGLAWVKTICSKYNWDLQFKNSAVTIVFPPNLTDQVSIF